MGALWGWCCQGSAQGQCGRGCPRPWQGQTPPPPKAHHPEAAAAAAAATGSVARGPARPWLGGRPDRRTEAPGSPRSQPQPRGPARPPAPSPRPGGFREPRPGEGGERGAGGAASGVGAGTRTSEVAFCSPRLSGPQPERGLRGTGPQHPSARAARGRHSRSPRLGLPWCPADSHAPLREPPDRGGAATVPSADLGTLSAPNRRRYPSGSLIRGSPL